MAVGFPAKTNFATGDVLTATQMNDITGTLNLLQSTLYPAGRNKIINGDFGVNQRGFSSETAGGYNFDRWQVALSGGTCTYTAQTFALGTAPVAGYEGKNFLRLTTSVGNDLCRLAQSIESVRTFAGQTAVLSFWAKGTNPTSPGYLAIGIQQNFGTGGSPSATVTSADQNFTLTADWTRYSFTIAVPSIAGKTIGTNGNDKLDVMIGQLTNASTNAWTLDIWGVQLEAASTGSTASPFQTASGSIAGELALCQRYYFRAGANSGGTTSAYSPYGSGYISSATEANFIVKFPQTMRANPTDIGFGNLAVSDSAGNFYTLGSIAYTGINTNGATIYCYGLSGMTANRPAALLNNNNTAGYFYASSEL
jgi:hypothetical protein